MSELIHQYATLLDGQDGERYAVRVYAGRRPRGLWEACFVFIPLSGGNPLVTDRETTQSKRQDVVYWAGGISRLYLQGAVSRAHEKTNSRFIAPVNPEETRAGSGIEGGALRMHPCAGMSGIGMTLGRRAQYTRDAVSGAPTGRPSRRPTRLLCLRGCTFQQSLRRGLSLQRACPFRPNVVCALIRVPPI